LARPEQHRLPPTFTVDNKVLKNGGPPILLEPVKATVTIAGRTNRGP